MQKQQPCSAARKIDHNIFQCKTNVKAGLYLAGYDENGNVHKLLGAKLSDGNKAIAKIELDGLSC